MFAHAHLHFNNVGEADDRVYTYIHDCIKVLHVGVSLHNTMVTSQACSGFVSLPLKGGQEEYILYLHSYTHGLLSLYKKGISTLTKLPLSSSCYTHTVLLCTGQPNTHPCCSSQWIINHESSPIIFACVILVPGWYISVSVIASSGM